MNTLTQNGVVNSYLYNADGIRTQKTVNGTATEYFLNGSAILAEKTGDTVIWYIYDSDGTILGFTYNGTTYYYVKNMQDDVLAIVDASNNVVGSYTYDAWGKVLSVTGTISEINPIRYRGYYYDTETGLYYLNSRYYDPEIGRFVNADNQLATGDMTGMNLFSYCGNNPVNRTDSSGEAWLHWAIGAAIVVACALITVATCGGFAAAAMAVGMVSSGIAASTVPITVAAAAFIGSASVYGMSALMAMADSSSAKQFAAQGSWGTVGQPPVARF